MADDVQHSWLIMGQGMVLRRDGEDIMEVRVEKLGAPPDMPRERAVLLAYGPVGSDFAAAAQQRREAQEQAVRAARAMGGIDQVE